MTHTYEISGMTCSSCEAKVKSALLTLPDVNNAEVTRTAATITVEKHIALSELQKAIGAKGVVRTTKRVLSPDYVDTMELARKASRLGVNVSELMTARQISANQL
mgnify:CR=1 FL=1